MRPTRWPVLVAVAALAAAVAYPVTGVLYDDLPSPQLYTLFWIAVLAAAELYVAAVTRARLQGRPGTRPVHPLGMARLAALAKASSAVGAVFTGAYAGFFGWVVQRSSTAAMHDARVAAVGAGFSAVLVVAALVLERVCRVKDDDDQPSRR